MYVMIDWCVVCVPEHITHCTGTLHSGHCVDRSSLGSMRCPTYFSMFSTYVPTSVLTQRVAGVFISEVCLIERIICGICFAVLCLCTCIVRCLSLFSDKRCHFKGRNHGDCATMSLVCGLPMCWHGGSLLTSHCAANYMCDTCLSVCPSVCFTAYMSVILLLLCIPLAAKAKPRRPSFQKNHRKTAASAALPHTATLSTIPSPAGGVAHTQERQQYREVDHHDSVPPTYLEVLEKDQRDKLKQSNTGRALLCCVCDGVEQSCTLHTGQCVHSQYQQAPLLLTAPLSTSRCECLAPDH